MLGAGFLEKFNSSIDDGGRYGASRAYAGGSVRFELTPTLDFQMGVGFEYDHYRFSGSGPFDPAPWRDIVAVGLSPRLTLALSEHWSVSGGVVVQYSGEIGASFDDSIQWGGIAAVRYAFDRDHVIGLGLLVITQLEDDPLFLPLPLVDWHLGDDWRISNLRGPEANPFTGLELVKGLDRSWEVAAGAAYVSRRFRLDNDGPVPMGVGAESSVPIYARLTFRPQPWIRFDLLAGVSVFDRLELDQSNGDRIAASDADPAPILGFFASIRF